MRIVHLLRKLDPQAWGGTETAIQRLCLGILAHGVTPVIYCPETDSMGTVNTLEKAGIEVRRFKAFVPVLGMEAARKKQLISVGGNLMSFDLLNQLWRHEEMDVVHSHALGRIGGIALTVARRKNVPFVVSIHGGVLDLPPKLKQQFHESSEQGWEWGRFFGLIFQSHRLFVDADAIITCNEKEAGLLRETHPNKRILVQPHAVPFETFEADAREVVRERFPQIRGKRVLLSVGRIDPVKNQVWLVKQMQNFLTVNRDCVLVLAGPCTDEAYGHELERELQGLPAGAVLQTGGFQQDDPCLIGLMQLASVVILPSISETFGLVLLEAWAAGAPVVASGTSGARALIRNGQNGWLFDLEQPATFHQALDALLSNPQKARAMAQTGKERVRQEFSIKAVAGRMKALYSDLVQEKKCVT